MPSPMHYLLQQTAGSGGMGGLMNSAEFVLPLQDLGNGAVDTSLGRGVGPATFTRATAAAAKLSTGLWKLDVASGTARSSYIGLTTAVGAYGGYLAEGAATQLALNPRDMTQAAWIAVTMTTAKTSTGIDGVASSCTRITSSGVNATILQTLVAAATSRTYSCWVKRITGTGTVLLKQGTATLDITALINSATFTLVQLNDNELNVAYGLQINTSGDALDVDCNQFEAGAFATTPIPAAGTRNADALTYPSSGNLDPAAGSSYAELGTLAVNPSGTFVAVGGTGNTAPLQIVNSSTVIGILDSTTVVTKSGLTDLATSVRKRASSWGGASMSAGGDGAAMATGAFDGSMSATSIGVGENGGGTQAFYGTVKNVRIWQRQLPDAALQAITI